MKLERFNLLNLAIFFVLIGLLSAVFYYAERVTTLHYISERINQNFFQLEQNIQQDLQEGRLENLQEILDQTGAIVKRGVKFCSFF